MNSAPSRKLGDSLGESWGDAEYESDGGASIQTASDLGSDVLSESDLEDLSDHEQAHKEPEDVATPLPPSRATRALEKTNHNIETQTPVKTPTNRTLSRHLQTPRASTTRAQPRSSQSTPGSSSGEPSFIMPTMYTSRGESHDGSPLRKSQLRARRPRSSSQMDQQVQPHQPQPQPPRQPANAEPAWAPWDYLQPVLREILLPVLRYVLNVGGLVMGFLKPIIAALVTVWVIGFLTRSATNAIKSTLSPICYLPLSSYVLPFCADFKSFDPENIGPEFDNFMEVQSNLEDIVKENQDAYTLPQTMKDSEVAIRDLKTVVQYSKLPSKHMLVVEFDTFIETAKEASADLIKFNLKIGSTVDKIISTNRWTMQILQGYSDKEAETGALERAVAALNPIRAFTGPPLSVPQKVFELFVNHISANVEEINRLIDMSMALLGVLNNLGERSDVIHSIAVHDDLLVNQNKDELLSQLWTKFGGNKSTRKEYERQLQLLRDVFRYRKKAIELVSSTLIKLQHIAAGLEDLRDTVAAPETLGFQADIPITHYIELMEKATDRLQDARGVARQAERVHYQTAMGRGGDEAQGALPGRKDEPPVVYAKHKDGTRK